jgi:predicted nucleotidyltransferase
MREMTGKKLMPQISHKTLAFFDAQDLALTSAEAANYNIAPSPGEGREAVGGERLRSSRDGLFFLSGRENLIQLRKQRYKISLTRLRKAKKVLYWLRFFPYIRGVAISGSLALLNSDEKSDIDLFIIAKKNRIWLTRAMVSAYLQALGQRRHGRLVQNRFCLNHYLTADMAIDNDRNLYTAVEYASLLPVIGSSEFEKFWVKNGWIKDYLPNAVYTSKVPFFDIKLSSGQKSLEYLLDFLIAPVLNYLLGVYQKHRIKLQDYIFVSDDELSFHPGSRGQKVLAKYKQSLHT